MIHIMIVDDHAVFAESLAHRLENEDLLSVVAIAHNSTEAKKFLEDSEKKIDLALVDIRIQENDTEGMELATFMKKEYRYIKIIMLSMHNEGSYGKKMLDAGIPGYVLKSSHIQEVLQAIRFVHEGKRFYSREIEESMAKYERRAKEVKVSNINLTPSEHKILKYIAKGLSSKDISDKMGNKESTVEVHRRNIFTKFGVNKVALLITEAIRLKFIDMEE